VLEHAADASGGVGSLQTDVVLVALVGPCREPDLFDHEDEEDVQEEADSDG